MLKNFLLPELEGTNHPILNKYASFPSVLLKAFTILNNLFVKVAYNCACGNWMPKSLRLELHSESPMVIVHRDLSLLHGWPQSVEFSPPWTMKVVCHPACPHHQGYHCYLLMQVSLVLYELLVLPIPAGLSTSLHWFWT
jgi:hypothetical protein